MNAVDASAMLNLEDNENDNRIRARVERVMGHAIFITGGTGYMGRSLIPLLAQRGHSVRALARKGSESRLPPGCAPVVGDALDEVSFAG